MTTPETTLPETTLPEIDPHAEHLRLVEALLFAASAPLDAEALKERLPTDADLAVILVELEAHYRGRGVNLVRIAEGWTLRTAPDLAPRLNLERKVARKLSRAAVETLAIIAYHQPVTRAEIEDIRGVVISKGTLDTLMETGWIAPKGRKQTPGRPVTWVTTEAFLLHFSLADIGDLPGVEELRAAGLIGPRPVTTLSETVQPHALVREEEEREAEEEGAAAGTEADPGLESESEPDSEPQSDPENGSGESVAAEADPRREGG